MLYPVALLLHSWNRWLVLLAAAFALWRAWRGWLGRRPFTATDNAAGSALTGLLHLQALLGMWLYFDLSPVARAARHDWGAALHNPTLRFWGVEHITAMLTAVVVAQLGRSFSRRAADPVQRHRLAAQWFTVAVALILLAIPFLSRPLFRF